MSVRILAEALFVKQFAVATAPECKALRATFRNEQARLCAIRVSG